MCGLDYLRFCYFNVFYNYFSTKQWGKKRLKRIKLDIAEFKVSIKLVKGFNNEPNEFSISQNLR